MRPVKINFIRGILKPEKNITTIKKDIKIMWEYSAKKNNAKAIEAYSTLNPETSSDSPSVRSKGALFVSARQETNKIIAIGRIGMKYDIDSLWEIIIFVALMDPVIRIITIIIKPIDTS